MRQKYIYILLCLSSCLLPLQSYGFSAKKVILDQNPVFQVSTIDAFITGMYDGIWPFSLPLQKGNFGIGGPHKLDGEIIILDGQVYQNRFDGSTIKLDANQTTSLTWVMDFHPSQKLTVPVGLTKDKLEQWMLDNVIQENRIYGIKISGTFSKIKTRAMPPQEKPYQPLASIIHKQSIFKSVDKEGVAVGFWFPQYIQGINIPGFHFHFLPEDLVHGGHILDFVTEDLQIEIDLATGMEFLLPEGNYFDRLELNKNTAQDLRNIKKGKKKAVTQ